MQYADELAKLVDLINATFKSPSRRARYLEYVNALAIQGLPPILSFAHAADVFGIDPPTLHEFAFRAKYYYTTFEVPKRSGGCRQISSPFAELASIQNWIRTNILGPVFPKFLTAVVGYVPGKSILDHVQPHLEAACLIKFDIKDFFPSITATQITKIFLDFGYSVRVARTLAGLVTLNGVLPQGACTSPYLSNIRMLEFDRQVTAFCEARNFRYTRYADDIVVSGSQELLGHALALMDLFKLHNLILNRKKTAIYRKPEQVRFVTGLMIHNGVVRLPKAMRRQIRVECHSLMRVIPELQAGSRAQESPRANRNQFLNDPVAVERTLGKLNYWIHVEPDHVYPRTMRQNILSQI